jgi:hypothetical protein
LITLKFPHTLSNSGSLREWSLAAEVPMANQDSGQGEVKIKNTTPFGWCSIIKDFTD